MNAVMTTQDLRRAILSIVNMIESNMIKTLIMKDLVLEDVSYNPVPIKTLRFFKKEVKTDSKKAHFPRRQIMKKIFHPVNMKIKTTFTMT